VHHLARKRNRGLGAWEYEVRAHGLETFGLGDGGVWRPAPHCRCLRGAKGVYGSLKRGLDA
jgi:hypothetical protein